MDAIPINHIEIKDGRAMIRGKNLKAKLVAAMVLKAGATIDETMEYYSLSHAEVYAALAYYYDNQDEIDGYIQEDRAGCERYEREKEEFLSKHRSSTPR